MWVKGHRRWRKRGGRPYVGKAGRWIGGGYLAELEPRIATYTPAGIRQAFPIHSKPKHLKWDRQVVKGLTYLMTDQGRHKWWLKVIERVEDDRWGIYTRMQFISEGAPRAVFSTGKATMQASPGQSRPVQAGSGHLRQSRQLFHKRQYIYIRANISRRL